MSVRYYFFEIIRLFRVIVVDVVHKVSGVVLKLVDVYLVWKINRKVLMDLRDDTCNVRMFGMLRVHLIFGLKIQFISDSFLLIGLREHSMKI